MPAGCLLVQAGQQMEYLMAGEVFSSKLYSPPPIASFLDLCCIQFIPFVVPRRLL